VKTFFFTGQMDVDTHPKFIKEGDYISAFNIFMHTGKDGKKGLLRRYPGFDITEGDPSTTTIGAVTDKRLSKVYYFNVPDTIWVYDLKTHTREKIFEWEGLNLHPVTGAAVIGNLLFWTDNVNEPRCIDVTRTYTNIKEEDIRLIKPAPLFPLNFTVTKTEVDYSNLSGKSFQFSYRYSYLNNQKSVIAPYTEEIYCEAKRPFVTEISLGKNEKENVPQYVSSVELLVREKGTDFWRNFKTVTRDQFINDERLFTGVRGVALSLSESQKPFESVPLKSKTMESARDRIFLANNTEGYDEYEVPSLAADLGTEITGEEPTYYPVWKSIRTQIEEIGPDTITTITENYYVRKDNGSVFYFLATGDVSVSFNGDPPAVTPGNYTGLEEELEVDLDDFIGIWDLQFSGINDSSVIELVEPIHNILVTTTTILTTGNQKFKSRSQYQIGLVFYDRSLRNQGVYTNDGSIVTIDDDYRSNIIKQISWSIDNIDRLNIPLWADAYQIVRTDNLDRVTFLQGRTSDVYWAYIEEGETKFSRSYRGDAEYIEVDISGTLKSGKGYNFTPGDLIEIFTPDRVVTLAIESVSGARLRVNTIEEPRFTNTVSPFPVRFYYEIYTPRTRTATAIVDGREINGDVFYEVSEVFEVLEAGTENRAFSVVSGFLKGDVIVVDDETFDYPDARNISSGEFSTNELESSPNQIVVEAMNPDNTNIWIKNLGRANAVLGIGQVHKLNFIRYSNRLIQGTKVNGTSRFDFGDEDQVPVESGEINRLVLIGKQQADGNVMLAICDQETSSIYLGETQFVDNEGMEVIGSSVRVIGTINTLKGGYGTKHPLSVVSHRDNAWWWDVYSKKVVRYDFNGIKPISDRENKSGFWAKDSDPFVCYDPFHEMLFIGFDDISTAFDEENNQWRGYYDFVPECSAVVDEYMVVFKNGIPYRSNSIGNSFFGQQYEGQITFPVQSSMPMILENMSMYLTGGFTWQGGRQIMDDILDVTITNGSGQRTTLIHSDFDILESVAYAHILRDELSEGGLLRGWEMRSDVHIFKVNIRGAEIEYINVNDIKSLGQK
jgi:hypothetical protein